MAAQGYDGPDLPHYHGDDGDQPPPVIVATIIGIGERFKAEKELGDFWPADFHLECLACCMKYLRDCGYQLVASDVTRVRLSLDHGSEQRVTCNLVQPNRAGNDWQFRVGPRAPNEGRPKYLLRSDESFNPTDILLQNPPAIDLDIAQVQELKICLGFSVDAKLKLESVGINALRKRHCRLAVTQYYMAVLLELYRKKQHNDAPELVPEGEPRPTAGRPPALTKEDWIPFPGVCEYDGITDSSKPDVKPDIDPLPSYSVTPDDTEVDALAADFKNKIKVNTPEKPKGKAKATTKVKSEGHK